MSHKICGTGHGGTNKATASTNCRSGAKGSDNTVLTNGGDGSKGLGIGSEDGGSENKALTAQQWDTLVTAFEADNAVTSNTGSPPRAALQQAPRSTVYRIATRLSQMWQGNVSAGTGAAASEIFREEVARECRLMPVSRTTK
ncbi:MAG: hypothetical protein ACTJLL_01795 [Anaplasma sp.]